MDESQKKAFDFAVDLTKQLITLATAIITLTVTFSKDIIGSVDDSNKYILLSSWIIFIVSILLGIFTLMALTGNLDPMPEKQPKAADGSQPDPKKKDPILTINSPNVTSTSKLQVYAFGIALILTIWYGYRAAAAPPAQEPVKREYMIIRETRLGVDSTAYIDTLYVPMDKQVK